MSRQLLLCYSELYIYMAREHKSLENESLKRLLRSCESCGFSDDHASIYIWGSDSQYR